MIANSAALKAGRRKKARENIVDAAIALLKEKDFSYFTVSNVCEAAGVSVGTFYHYFESIEELLRAFFVKTYEVYAEERHMERTGEPLNDLKLFFHSYFEFCEQQGLEFVRHFYDPHNTSLFNEVTLNAEEHFALPSLREAEQLIKKAQRQGTLRSDVEALTLAGDICTIEKGVMFEWCVSSGSIDAIAVADRLVGGYLDSYRAKKEDV